MNPNKKDPRIVFQSYEAIIKYANALEKKRGKYDGLAGGAAPEDLKALEEALLTHSCRIVVTGEFKRGKSSFINAVLGDRLLPEAVAPETAVQTEIRFSEQEWISVTTAHSKKQSISRTQMEDWLTQQGSQVNRVKEAEIGYPSSFMLDNDAVFIDTPGLNDSEAMDQRTFEAAAGADVIICVLSSNSPFSDTEREYTKKLYSISPDACFLFVMNKIDTVDEDDRGKLLDTAQKRILEMIQTQPEYGRLKENMALFACSSRDALKARRKGDNALLWASGIPQLREQLETIAVSVNQRRHLAKTLKVLNSQIETGKNGCDDVLADWSHKADRLEECRILMNTLENFFISEYSNRILQVAREAGKADISNIFLMTPQLKTCFEPLITGKGYGVMNECCGQANNTAWVSYSAAMERTRKKLDAISCEWRDAFIGKYNDIVAQTGHPRIIRTDLKADDNSFQPSKVTFGMMDFPTLMFRRSADARRTYIHSVIENNVQTCCINWVSLCESWAAKFRQTMNEQANELISRMIHQYELAAGRCKADIKEMKESAYYTTLTATQNKVRALLKRTQEAQP